MTNRYAVIGNPITHSKSPLIHKLFAQQTGLDINYEAILSPMPGFAALIDQLHREGYKGCNVTAPFKFNAFKCATVVSVQALAGQSVNTLSFEDGCVFGDTTDGIGLVRDIEQNLGVSLTRKRVLLMGTGGAASSVMLPLLSTRAIVTNVSRSLRLDVAGNFPDYTFHECGYNELIGKEFDVIINATSAGLNNTEVPLPSGIFAKGALAYDMMYGCETPFMKFARSEGAQVADGLGMLVEQAAESFYIWHGVMPKTAPIINTVLSLGC